MSKRNLKFQDEILPMWQEMQEIAQDLDVKGLSSDEKDEIAYLKKVIAYMTEMLNAIDADFIPLGAIDNIKNSTKQIKNCINDYNTNKDINYIRNLNNNYFDTLLRDVMPFIFYKGRAGRALTSAIKEYSQTVGEYAKSHIENLQDYQNKAKEIKSRLDELLTDAEQLKAKIDSYDTDLFGNEECYGIKDEIKNLVDDLDEKNKNITEFHSKIFNNGDQGVENQIDAYLQKAQDVMIEIKNQKDDVNDIVNDLDGFWDKIFGEKNAEGEFVGGLEEEVNKEKKELQSLKKKHKESYDALYVQIESLLPGATSAGLSSSYSQAREECRKLVSSYTGWFVASLALFLISVLYVHFFLDIKIDLHIVGIPDNVIGVRILLILELLLFKLPFVMPFIIGIVFTSKRRAEYQRLEQEYAHKEVLARSYESYKMQIDKLSPDDKDRLMPILMENMLNATALNPAETLDQGKGGSVLDELDISKKELKQMLKDRLGLSGRSENEKSED